MTNLEPPSLHQSKDEALCRMFTDSLLLQTLAHANRKLGSRRGSGPEMSADDLAMRAITDTLEGKRNWNATHTSLKNHLRGCINSYISHYFDSLQGRRTVDLGSLRQKAGKYGSDHGDSPSLVTDPEAWLRDDVTPEEHVEAMQTIDAINQSIRMEGDPKLIAMWELVWREHLNLKYDRVEICERLGIDVNVGGAEYQRFNRLRNRLKEIIERCLCHGFPLAAVSGDD